MSTSGRVTRTCWRSITLLLVGLVLGFLTPAAASEAKKVLVLHSYHQGFDWTDSIQQGLARSLSASYPDAELYVEYMNTKRQSIAVMSSSLRALYRRAYANVNFDVIVASDNNALDFLLRYRGELFPGVPVVFCGINDVENYHFDPASGYTGVSQAADIVSTIAVALRLQPKTRKIALVADATETGEISLAKVREIADQFPTIGFVELDPTSAARLGDELRQLSDDAVVLNFGFYRDGQGRVFTARESLDFILRASRRPVFATVDSMMAPGVVGGKLISGRLQGEYAASLVTRILEVGPASSQPIVAGPTEYVFDAQGLKTYGISEASLPADAVILGKPESFYARNQRIVWSGLAVFAVQVLIIGLLVWNVVSRRRVAVARDKAVDALRETNEVFAQFMRHSPIYVSIKEVSPDAVRVLLASDNCHELSGVSATGLVGKTMGELFPGELADAISDEDRHVVASGEVVRGEFQLGGRYYAKIKFPIALGSKRLLANYLIDITERKRSEAEILATKNRLQATLDAIPDLLFEVGLSGTIYNCHTSVSGQLVAPAQAFLSKNFADILPSDAAAVCRSALDEALEMGTSVGKEYSLPMPDAVHWFEISVALMPASGDDDRRFIIVARDISERKLALERLHLAASVFSHAREGIMITAVDGTIIDVNDSFERITGYSRAEVLGCTPRILKSGRHDDGYYAAMWRALSEKGHWSGELWNRRKDGSLFAAMQTISAVCDAQGVASQYVALFSDITKVKEHEKYLERIAHYDMLTGLPNRVLLADRLQQAMAQTGRSDKLLAVIYLDLDGFKAVNDQHGHAVGDQVLIALSNRMKKALRTEDTLARLGGDEFVAVLQDLEQEESCVATLTRLLDVVCLPVLVDGIAHSLSASIGVTFSPQAEDAGPDQLLRQADQAMYQAKLAGKNRYHIFDAVEDRSLRGHHESVEHIRRALSAREFVLYYQPKVNMRSGTLIGAEALIRWQHPQRGLLSPGVFLPVIENHPLSVEVGEWVIDTALAQIEAWRAQGLAIQVSVNVGARQLLQPDFVERLASLLAAHPAVRPGDLEIEVLETSALEDLARTSQVIVDCHELGASFSLDDFGTGYSSLTYLKRLEVKQLKIDQSFVRDMLCDPGDLSILGGVLGLATALRRQVIAEGVENVEQGTMLLQMGCELAQGYSIARPMPAAELPAWIDGWRTPAAWKDRSAIATADQPLLFAIVEHRAWAIAVEAVLQGDRELRSFDPALCSFSDLLQDDGLWQRWENGARRSVELVHAQAHALATELFAQRARGEGAAALGRLPELIALRDRLIGKIEALLASRPGR